MVRLAPDTSSQKIKFLPRVITEEVGLTLKITREGTNKSEELTVDTVREDNFMTITTSFSILVDDGMYIMELYKEEVVGDENIKTLRYRDKVYATDGYSQSSKYTLNDQEYNQSDAGDSDQQYIFV